MSGIFVLPPIYRTAGKILLTTDRAEVSAGDKAPSLVRTDEVSEGEINSQVQILKSRELIDQVLADMKPPKDDDDDVPSDSRVARILHAPPRPWCAPRTATAQDRQSEAGDDPLYWQTREVLDRLEPRTQHPSNIIDVGYVSPDPAWAQDFVNRLMQAYVEHHAKMQQISARRRTSSRSRARSCGRSWQSSEAELQKARERAGDPGGQQAEVHERLNEFNADLSRARIARVEQEQRVGISRRRSPAAKGGRVATPELIELEAKRADLLGKYKPDSERIREIDVQIERLRKAIAGYDSFTAG